MFRCSPLGERSAKVIIQREDSICKTIGLIHISRYIAAMKSAYELAMERLNKTSPTVKLSDAQKAEIAELESKYKAKIAQREIAVKGEIEAAQAADRWDKAEELQQEWVAERKNLLAELEEKKEQVRNR